MRYIQVQVLLYLDLCSWIRDKVLCYFWWPRLSYVKRDILSAYKITRGAINVHHERHDVPKTNREARTLIVRRISMLQRSISMLQVLHISVSHCRALTLSRDAEVLAEKRSSVLSDERRFRSSGTRRMQRSRSPS